MRLVDLRGSTTATTSTPVEARASEAAELLRLIGVVVGQDDHSSYDVGAHRVAALRAEIPDELFDRAQAIGGGEDRAFLTLSAAAARLAPPGDVDQLLTLLGQEPTLAWRLLLSIATQDFGWEDLPADAQALADGDADALARLRDRGNTDDQVSEDVRLLLATDPHDHGREIARIVAGMRDAVWGQVGAEAMAAIERDVEHRRARIADGEDVATLVLEATNGYALEDDPSVRRILLLPSFWLRPWIVVDQLHDVGTLVLSTPVADAFVTLPAEVPPPSLLKLTKALADEGRLKLLRRMTTGPISLGEATEQLGVAKATAHHHLSHPAAGRSGRHAGVGPLHALRAARRPGARPRWTRSTPYVPSRTRG